ncbi:unnamed protein product [Mytilus edulis]|uniref:TRPM SLOG domain-containing protein n=1 Tax=Mytilus edulis TaxID=6550 RepID=A0A8S3S0I8_MYTED|nr:unnamed protein product [Mytilus edulis]
MNASNVHPCIRRRKRKRPKPPILAEMASQTDGDSMQVNKTPVTSAILAGAIVGEPRIVLSVIGEYNKRVLDYSERHKSILVNLFKSIGIRAGRCGFLYHQQKMKWMQQIENTQSFKLKGFPEMVYQYYENDNKILQPKEDVVPETAVQDNDMQLLELETYINQSLYVKFGDENNKNVRVPVVLVAANGDLEILSHIARAVQCNISVVVMKGSGGVSDLIAMCIEDSRNIRKMSPLLLHRKIPEDIFAKIEMAISIITNRYWMITIFDLIRDTPESLWERLTDGIMRAWSYDQEGNKSVYVPSFKPIDQDVISISKYAVDIDWLSKEEFFLDTIKEILCSAILNQTTDVLRLLKNINMNNDDASLTQLYRKNVSPEAVQFFQKDTQPDSQKIKSAKDAEFQIGNNLLKWLCFSRVGMVTCCQKTRQHESKEESNIDDQTKDVKPFRFCVFSNDRTSASELWETCENPMLTALISSCYLKAMAKVAESWFEDSLQRNLEDHAKLFANRAVQLLDKLFQHDEEMATDALDHASVVWEYIESPLHFGHQFGMEDFISHTSTQKDANKRLYSYINYKSSDIIFNEKNKKDIDNNSPQPECPDFIKVRPRDGNCSIQRVFLYIFDIWNFMDIVCDVMYITAFLMHAVGPEEIHNDTRRIYSLALFLMFLRLYNILLMFKKIGIIIIIVKEMLVDLLYYLVILVILILAAGTVYHANIYPNHDVKPFPNGIQNWRIWTILKTPYWQVYGEPFLDLLEASDNGICTDNVTIWSNDPTVERCPTRDWITSVVAAFYMMLSNWLLLNIVIAMLSARFNLITAKSKQKWRYHRHSVVMCYENRIPSPINLVMRPLSFFCYVAKCPCCSCVNERPKGYTEKMLKKQRDLAKEIIRNENGET